MHHPLPEKLGEVHFETSCAPEVASAFNRAIALLHSFTYEEADRGFADVIARDPGCAIAYWGRAMTHYHQLWDVPAGADLATGIAEVSKAEAAGNTSPRERKIIEALKIYYANADHVPAAERALRYSNAMAAVTHEYQADDEIAVFYALSLIASALPSDRAHQRQKHAAEILEPLWKRHPDHPGVPHYLIHAYDSAELARLGLPAARAYAAIAPSAPHALHMPSHIFTRLGLWDDSIRSNIAARNAALALGDVGEQLHAMDYLTYAYIQSGRVTDAAREVAALRALTGLSGVGFKIGYAANAMPVRLAVETGDWEAASHLSPIAGSSPQVAALVWWARALGKLRAATPRTADADIAELEKCRAAIAAKKDSYWLAQTDVLLKSAQAWGFEKVGNTTAATTALTAAAVEEDALEKLPLTPGPIVPAREQLGELFLVLNKPSDALRAFDTALALAPGRLGASKGKLEAERRIAGRQQIGTIGSADRSF